MIVDTYSKNSSLDNKLDYSQNLCEIKHGDMILFIRDSNQLVCDDLVLVRINNVVVVKTYKIIGELSFLVSFDNRPIYLDNDVEILGKVIKIYKDV